MNVDTEYIQRSTRAYLRRCKRTGVIPDQPSNTSEVIDLSQSSYVVLRNSRGVLAAYQILAHTNRLKLVMPEEVDRLRL